MVFTEVKSVNGKKYFYRVQSVRKGKKIGKKRVYLGANLSRGKLKKQEIHADKVLMLLSTLLSDKEIKELEVIKSRYQEQPRDNAENRYEAFCSLFTYNSTAIEGNTLTLQETAQLLFENRTPSKSLREINEVLNHRAALDLILSSKDDISKKLILTLHEMVVKNTLKPGLEPQIGKFRTVQVFIRGSDWLPPQPKDVPPQIRSLLLWYSRNKDKLHPLLLAVYFHSAFEAIHPFVDGNGRVGRLLMNLIMHKKHFPMVNIPNSRKSEYYKVLHDAQVKADLRPFAKFMLGLLKDEKIIF